MCNLGMAEWDQELDQGLQTPTGHCRAQRQELYSRSDKRPTFPSEKTMKHLVFSFKGSDDDWAECREELERWGMEITEMPATTKPSRKTTENTQERQ